jgi:hypothetical protein
MSGTRVRMRDEGDIDEDDAAPPPGTQATHAGLGDMAEPVDGRPPPPARQQSREQAPPLEVVEVGEDGQPVDPRYREAAEETQPPPQDRRLHEETQETYVDQQRRERRPHETTAQKTRRIREARDRTLQDNARLRQQVAEQEARLAELQHQVGGIEPRLAEFDRGRAQQQLGDLDRQIAEQQNFAKIARTRISEAVTAGDGNAIAEALEARDQALMAANQLQVRRNMLASGNPFGEADARQAARHQQSQPAPIQQPIPPPSRAVRERISEFAEDHPWYQLTPRRMPDGSVQNVPADLESKIMWTIDNEIANEGFDPATDDYWDEIRERGRQYLPHRFGGQPQRQAATRQNGNGRYEDTMPRAQPRQPEARGPRVAGGSDRAPGPRANQVYISPGRKEALIAAGALGRDGRTVENRPLYDKYVSGYAKYDRDNAGAQQ